MPVVNGAAAASGISQALRRSTFLYVTGKCPPASCSTGTAANTLVRVRAEGEEAAITVLHDKFARAPGRVAKGSCELDSLRDILGV